MRCNAGNERATPPFSLPPSCCASRVRRAAGGGDPRRVPAPQLPRICLVGRRPRSGGRLGANWVSARTPARLANRKTHAWAVRIPTERLETARGSDTLAPWARKLAGGSEASNSYETQSQAPGRSADGPKMHLQARDKGCGLRYGSPRYRTASAVVPDHDGVTGPRDGGPGRVSDAPDHEARVRWRTTLRIT